jgi:hypothetical protein
VYAVGRACECDVLGRASATRAAAPETSSADEAGTMTPPTPKCAALRSSAPRLCGLPTPSSHSSSDAAGARGSAAISAARSRGGARSISKHTPS